MEIRTGMEDNVTARVENTGNKTPASYTVNQDSCPIN